jgi:hypothetical protein
MALSDRRKAFVLVVFAPVFAEMLSGSTPPLAFLFPWVLGIFMMIYGVSALLIRELSVRWRTGPAGVILLGLAFGILNEGMAAHSLFNPNWPDLGALGGYGRWVGVNGLWTEWIVPFHAVWSMAFPIFLARQFWPEIADGPLVSTSYLYLLAAVPFAGAVLTTLFFIGYNPPLGDWVGMVLAIGALGALSYRWAPAVRDWWPTPSHSGSPRLAATLGVLFFVGGQIGTFATPRLGPYPEVGFFLLGLMYLAFGIWAASTRPGPEGDRTRFAFVLGGFGFYVALSPLADFGLGRVGLVPIDVAVLVFFVLLYRRRAFVRSGVPVPPGPGADSAFGDERPPSPE